MTTTKFKIGDRVRVAGCKGSYTIDLTGHTGAVHSCWPNGKVYVQLDDMLHFTSPPRFDESELALEAECEAAAPVQPAPQTIDATLDERGKRYGKFTGHASVTQQIKDAMYTHNDWAGWQALAPDQREALEMIAHKIGRILNGDPNYADSWVDIAGYAKLVADRLEGVER